MPTNKLEYAIGERVLFFHGGFMLSGIIQSTENDFWYPNSPDACKEGEYKILHDDWIYRIHISNIIPKIK